MSQGVSVFLHRAQVQYNVQDWWSHALSKESSGESLGNVLKVHSICHTWNPRMTERQKSRCIEPNMKEHRHQPHHRHHTFRGDANANWQSAWGRCEPASLQGILQRAKLHNSICCVCTVVFDPNKTSHTILITHVLFCGLKSLENDNFLRWYNSEEQALTCLKYDWWLLNYIIGYVASIKSQPQSRMKTSKQFQNTDVGGTTSLLKPFFLFCILNQLTD